MAFRYEQNLNGENDLVIDGFEKGIADSPFRGLGNIRNLNIKYYDGVTYVNYKRKQANMGFGDGAFFPTVTLGIGATSATLTTAWIFPTGSYSTTFQGGDVRTVSYTKGSASITWTGGLTVGGNSFLTPAANVGRVVYSTQSPAGVIYLQSGGNVFKQTQTNGNDFRMIGSKPTTTQGTGISFWNNYLLVYGTNRIDICGDGSGDAGVVDTAWNTSASSDGVWPIVNTGTVALTGAINAGDTSATISSYTDAQGTVRAFWNGPTGVYSMFTGSSRTGDHYAVALTQGSATINFTPVAVHASASSNVFFTINDYQPAINKTLISRNDGLLYFCNGDTVGSLQVKAFTKFSKSDMTTFTFNYAALSLPPTEISNNLEELRNNLIVTTNFNIYPWDRFSPQWQNPVPLQEKIYNMINILNNLYIFAGNKGNIYISNGYSAERYKKMPDYLAGVVDPSWFWGGVMSHRQKLWFQALAVNGQSSAAILAGIFSIDLDNKALNMESQNSFGVTPAFLATNTNNLGFGYLLIDNTPADYVSGSSTGAETLLNYDNYYSAWYQGVTSGVGAVDYNDTTLWSGGEPFVESDIIPIGTAVQLKTFRSMEFKLDTPLRSGDSISVYARQSLSDSYTLVGTTTTAVLSEFYPTVSFQGWQWIQIKAVMSCNATATSSSFNRLREIRLR